MAALSPSTRGSLGHLAQAIAWDMGRHLKALRRKFGILVFVLPLCVTGSAAALLFASTQQRLLEEARQEHAERASANPPAPPLGPVARGRARIRNFEGLLPAADDIPDTLASVLGMAREAGVSIKRGEYKAVVEPAGGFLRYEMALPVTGDPTAVVGFLRAAMLEHRSLTVESVRFSRPETNSRQVEARVNWVLFARLPRVKDGAASERRVAAERPATGTP